MAEHGDIAHRAAIAITELHMRHRVDDLVGALLDRIEELEARADKDLIEMNRLRQISDIAVDAIHCKNFGSDPSLSEAQRCVNLVSALGWAISEHAK